MKRYLQFIDHEGHVNYFKRFGVSEMPIFTIHVEDAASIDDTSFTMAEFVPLLIHCAKSAWQYKEINLVRYVEVVKLGKYFVSAVLFETNDSLAKLELTEDESKACTYLDCPRLIKACPQLEVVKILVRSTNIFTKDNS